MLQYITQPETRYSIAEQCQMVIEGGCEWIQLHLPTWDDSAIRELARLLIPLCKESSTILTLENRPELAKELGVHGIHLTSDSGLKAAEIREEFGPEAIIGTDVRTAAEIIALKDSDIDYVTVSEDIPNADKKEIIEQAALAGNIMPVVARGKFLLEDVHDIFRTGISGICTGAYINEADDPVEYTALLIQKIKGKPEN